MTRKTKDHMTLYNFEQVNQEGRYVKVANLFCRSDRQALAQARRLDPAGTFTIVEDIAVKRVVPKETFP